MLDTASLNAALVVLPQSFALHAQIRPVPTVQRSLMRISVPDIVLEESEESSYSEPSSPDSGFSSDDGTCPLRRKLERAKTLPSALRRSRSKQQHQSKKSVRFADSLGLDLEKLQYFVEEEQQVSFYLPTAVTSSTTTSARRPAPPPSSATVIKCTTPACSSRLVLSNFAYRSQAEYNHTTREKKLCVTALRASGTTVVGQVNLLNIAFDKTVIVRYTIDGWKSTHDVSAKFSHKIHENHDLDAFNFSIYLPNRIETGKCEFCVVYTVIGQDYWDNNDGMNYAIDVVKDNVATMTSLPFRPAPVRKWSQRSRQIKKVSQIDDSDDYDFTYRRTL